MSKRRNASTLAFEAFSGTTTVARAFSRVAANATPRPWFPAEAVTTGRPSRAAVATAASAPRTLNDPVGCSDSSLRYVGGSKPPSSTRTRRAIKMGLDDRLCLGQARQPIDVPVVRHVVSFDRGRKLLRKVPLGVTTDPSAGIPSLTREHERRSGAEV